MSGRPSEPEIDAEMSSACTGIPSIETIRSPGWSPADCAGEPCEISSTVVVALPTDVM